MAHTPRHQPISPDGFLRGCGVALVMATIISAAVARWWPFGAGFPAFAGGALAGVAIAFLFVPWRWIEALRQHIRALERLARHAGDVADPRCQHPRGPGGIGHAEMQSVVDSLAALSEQCRALELELKQARRNRKTAIEHETRKATVDLRRQASTDQLTGLANRRVIEPWVAKLDTGASRRGRIVAVVAIDLDHFKPINDTHGHEVGDACLRFLGQLLRSHVRGDDCAIRCGGDEFILLMHANEQDAQRLSGRLRTLFAQMPWPHSSTARPGLSIGVAGGSVSDMHGMNALLRRADEALYAAKRGGRGRTILAPTCSRAVA